MKKKVLYKSIKVPERQYKELKEMQITNQGKIRMSDVLDHLFVLDYTHCKIHKEKKDDKN